MVGWRYYNAMWMNRMDNGAVAVAPSMEANVYAVGRAASAAFAPATPRQYADVGGFMFEAVEVPEGTEAFSPFGNSRSASREAIL